MEGGYEGTYRGIAGEIQWQGVNGGAPYTLLQRCLSNSPAIVITAGENNQSTLAAQTLSSCKSHPAICSRHDGDAPPETSPSIIFLSVPPTRRL